MEHKGVLKGVFHVEHGRGAQDGQKIEESKGKAKIRGKQRTPELDA